MQFGSLQLESKLFLSPLAGYTNLPFRLVLREVGGLGLTTTDLVNARSLLERNPKALKLIETNEADSPLAVQLFGAVPEEMRDASQYLESIGIHSIDINMGCLVRKVCKTGGGSAMMTELDKTAHLVKMMVDSVSIPITAKMRLGWDDNNITGAQPRARARGRRRARGVHPRPDARAGLHRDGEPDRHPRGGRGCAGDSGDRQRRRDDAGVGTAHDRGHRLRRGEWGAARFITRGSSATRIIF